MMRSRSIYAACNYCIIFLLFAHQIYGYLQKLQSHNRDIAKVKGQIFLSPKYSQHSKLDKTKYFQRQLKTGYISRLYQSSNDDLSLLEQMRKALGEREDILGDMEQDNKQVMQGLRELDKDPNLRANNKFVEWLGDNGVWVKTISVWGRAPHPLVIASNTESDGETCGRGLLGRESIAEGELLMTVPMDLCFTKTLAQEILGKDVISESMDEYIAISLLLMTERIKGSSSRWKPYFDVLPDVSQVYPSYIWTEVELDTLKGSPVYPASKSLRAKLEKEYEELQRKTLKRFAQRLPVEKMSFELFLWSFVMLFSRAARLTSKINGEELALVPYADLMNHNPYSNTYIDAQRSGMPLLSRKEEIAVYADRPYKKFEQVFINYGEKGNGDLLLLYGFALDRNPFDSVDISVGLSQEDPLFSMKKRVLENQGRLGATSVRFPLQRNRYPSELVDFLRLLLVEKDDLGMQPIETTNFNEPITPSLERRVLTTMMEICRSYIAQYPTTLAEDEALMADKNTFSSLLTRQQRMAIKLRASEKRILMQTMKAVQDELDKLPSNDKRESGQEASMGYEDIVPAGRSFDVLSQNSIAKRQQRQLARMRAAKQTSTASSSSSDAASEKKLGMVEEALAMMSAIADKRGNSGTDEAKDGDSKAVSWVTPQVNRGIKTTANASENEEEDDEESGNTSAVSMAERRRRRRNSGSSSNSNNGSK